MNRIDIALTGAMGSGKSAAAEIFAELGAEVLDADKLCKDVLCNDEDVKERVRTLLGSDVFDSEGAPLKSRIAEKIFKDRDILERYEAIIHPAARKLWEKPTQGANTPKFRVVEMALLFEKKLAQKFKICVSVYCSEVLRLERLRKRGMSPEEISARDAFQLASVKKAELADVVLFNESDRLFLKKQIALFLSRF